MRKISNPEKSSPGMATPLAALLRRLRLGALVAAATAAAAVSVSAQPTLDLKLQNSLRGLQALETLKDRLELAAQINGMQMQRLRDILSRDRSAWLDRQGRLFFVEPALNPLEAGAGTASGPASAATPAALADTFNLHSRAGSARVLYLDFNGYTATNTAWNAGTITAEPYSLDADKANFSDLERQRIQGIWQRVAEDYAPFDVDVTTQEPLQDDLRRTSSADQRYGQRIVVTRNTFYNCSCGGVAYIGTADYYSTTTPDRYQPGWVFFDALGNGDEKFVAEAASHEAGHTFGLSHDGSSSSDYYAGHGSGATGWAPIMGVGYSKALTQWSRGEYPGANNTEDDLTLMAANGAVTRTDDFGNSTGTAAVLAGRESAGSMSVEQPGLITTANDVDVFAFTSAAGTVQFSAVGDDRSSNLDIALSLLDANGQVLVRANDPDGLNASLSATLAGGKYYLQIEGVGDDNPAPGYSDYGSLGVYRISGSYPLQAGSNQAPKAVATVTPLSGVAPLAVSFDASNSSDADGSISRYAWSFGDGASGSGLSTSHSYTSAGTYTASLTVTDDSGATDSTSVTITATAPALSPPTAVASADKTSGMAALSVNFSGTGSRDSDGSVVSYRWTFGDGSSADGAAVNHVYASAGNYVASLTVTDNSGLTGSSSLNISVSARPPATAVHVAGITMSVSRYNSFGFRNGKFAIIPNYQCSANVTVRNQANNVIPGATVNGSWSGTVTGSGSAKTGSNGLASLKSATTQTAGSCSFTVSGIQASGYAYDAGANSGNPATLSYQ